ncbi:hypothetical protein CANTEDRAFT_96752 [Yamadazyma tenuis ATCC 10573]|uniref:Bud site selection protein RAX2 n=1 Tax=Candida tenuis (strain ATCC 10573 / BCRC 21748 / CBS 615 / JCM 9827 / NBRC 10315 / NRRL Y-1498 / VKM Y-70) TaxID=590646 RepID=G3AZN9_CANTC|nr:uncharacterized protein CANTEDRAFT_96752 [Yamadazyma tenuis ATCC 10573]EGV65633.1 hypothetical protein CANTEDRAFT_96752 [Yamadazyma tenuis ATCC 10573]
MYKLLVPLLLLLRGARADSSSSISHPSLDYGELGGKLGLLGGFNSISYYSSANATGSLTGSISSIQQLSDDTILINGDFDSFNQQACQPPIIYNLTSNDLTNLFSSASAARRKRDSNNSLPSLNGTVETTYIDGDLIYLGGDFEYNDSHGAVVYNSTSKQLIELPFKGFGKNSSVNAITKVDGGDDNGSIIFGGYFDTLGIPDLLVHNITALNNSTKHSNSTNTSLITAEQKISLKHGTFTDVNGDGSSPSSLICPSTGSSLWAPQDNSGGQWLVTLPSQMQGLTPTKVRLYIPDGADSIDTFRIYSYPNNGIMNLTYVDPDTNEIAYCDASCPLSALSSLKEATQDNLDNIADLDVDDVFIGEDDGTFSMYYDSSTQTKTLSYGKNFQEFAFENDVMIDQIGLTVISWHGSKGAVAGFELYSNSIFVYGNETLNEPDCDEDPDKTNKIEINSGSFDSIASIDSSLVNMDYQVSTGGDGKVTLYPNISYSGDYSIIMITPGCISDDSCDLRSIVNVTVYDSEDELLARKSIYQNNNYKKFDYLFYGHLEGSTLSEGQTRIEVEFDQAIVEGTQEPWMVIDKIRADIVELDDYYNTNSTNHTRTKNGTYSGLVELKINGLFEYSLANFSSFNEDMIYTVDDDISPDNLFVGNSTINVLSSELSNDTVVKQFNADNGTLLVLGSFSSNSSNLTLSNDNLINFKISKYNTTSNFTVADIQKRSKWGNFDIVDTGYHTTNYLLSSEDVYVDLVTRADVNSSTIFGGTFNNSITTVSSYGSARVFIGRFQMTNQDDSGVEILDLSNGNKSVDEANNFVLYANEDFYSFGNDFIDETFDTFTFITLPSAEYFIFSSSEDTRTWDNSNKEWITNPNRQLNITEVITLSDGSQIVSGSSFNPMDNYFTNQAYFTSNDDVSNGSFDTFNIDLDGGNITVSYYINDSVSVIGGNFQTTSKTPIVDVGFLSTKDNHSFTGVQGNIEWTSNATIQTVYVDSNDEYLFIGYNNSVSVNGLSLSGGVIIYDIKSNNFTSFQPAELSNSAGGLEVNAIVYYENGKKLLVGGNFDSAGSLDCQGLCIYDIKNTRWESPNSDLDGNYVSDIKFIKSNEVLITGALSLENKDSKFAVYNLDKDEFDSAPSSLNNLSSDDVPTKLIMSDDSYDDDLKGRFIVVGNGFIKGYNGSEWSDIEGIDFSNETRLADVKLLTLKKSNSDNDQTYFSKNQILAVAGKFKLQEYGLVNVAFYDGKIWTPLAYTTLTGTQLGSVNSILVKDQFRYLSSADIENKSSKLSSGKVVGISLACALGSTTFLSLLYIIPYLALFRKNKENETTERIGEKEMMDAVNPEELFHEIDLQRHH